MPTCHRLQRPLVSRASEYMAHLSVAEVGCMYIGRGASALSFSHKLAFDFAAHQFRFLPSSNFFQVARRGREVAVGIHSGEECGRSKWGEEWMSW